MGLEASKTKQINGSEYYQRFMSGKVLDIGCGPDLVVEHAQPFDEEHGDANNILDYIAQKAWIVCIPAIALNICMTRFSVCKDGGNVFAQVDL